MLLKALFVAATAAVLVPLAGGTASASCLDDALARDLGEGYTSTPKSEHWSIWYVEQSGPATVTVHGDDAVADWSNWATVDMPLYTEVIAGNTVDTTTDFADCVAG